MEQKNKNPVVPQEQQVQEKHADSVAPQKPEVTYLMLPTHQGNQHHQHQHQHRLYTPPPATHTHTRGRGTQISSLGHNESDTRRSSCRGWNVEKERILYRQILLEGRTAHLPLAHTPRDIPPPTHSQRYSYISRLLLFAQSNQQENLVFLGGLPTSKKT